jgi:hypothetical protein
MSKRPLLSCCVVALTLAVPELAWAQAPGSCPPGSWFCAEAPQAPAGPAGQPVQVQVQPGYGPAPAPPVVVYQPPPPVVVYQAPQTRYYAVPPPPPAQVYYVKQRRQRSEWGINLHLEGAAFGAKPGVTSDGIWGGGIGLRFRPVPVFALETDLDFVGGTDWNGYNRSEVASTINGLFFLNPHSRAQVYLLAGFGWDWATVSGAPLGMQNPDYFGGQGGLGLEFRAAKHLALNFDVRGFIRTRIDDNASYVPEFTSNGETTNTSAGVIFTGGLTFYF